MAKKKCYAIKKDNGIITKTWDQCKELTNGQPYQFAGFATLEEAKAACHGITVTDREESYTSKASFLDMDYIPTYGKDDNVQFSGKRKKRGLYLSKNGITIHADVNGSGNIIRKEFPDAFDGVTDLSYIRKTQTWNSTKWYIHKAASSRIVTDFVTQAVG